MASIRHEIWLDAPTERVFELLSSAEGISTWWDRQTEKETPEGVVFEHNPGPEHGVVRFLVLESEPHKVVRWRCISTHPENTPAFEWTGTEIAFHLGYRSYWSRQADRLRKTQAKAGCVRANPTRRRR